MTNNPLGGRPTNDNRSIAILQGYKTYHGKACKKCGGTERYTAGGACLPCQRNTAIAARLALKQITEQQAAPDAEQEAVNDGFDSPVDSESEERYLRQDEIPQPWD